MRATLVAAIGNVPLKCKVFHVYFDELNEVLVGMLQTRTSEKNYLSLLPQEEPHADGFGCGSSPAPQADGLGCGSSHAPQAEGLASPSFEPQEEPHPEVASKTWFDFK